MTEREAEQYIRLIGRASKAVEAVNGAGGGVSAGYSVVRALSPFGLPAETRLVVRLTVNDKEAELEFPGSGWTAGELQRRIEAKARELRGRPTITPDA